MKISLGTRIAEFFDKSFLFLVNLEKLSPSDPCFLPQPSKSNTAVKTGEALFPTTDKMLKTAMKKLIIQWIKENAEVQLASNIGSSVINSLYFVQFVKP